MLMNKDVCQIKVVQITWERVLLHIDVRVEKGDIKASQMEFYAVNEKNEPQAVFDKEILDDTTYRLTINITNDGFCKCLEEGKYTIVMCKNGKGICKVGVSDDFVPKMADCTRQFMHHQNQGYLVNFYVVEETENLLFFMEIMQVVKDRIDLLNNKKLIKGAWKQFKNTVRGNMGRMVWRTYYMHYAKKYAKRKKVVLFLSEQGDNLRKNLTSVMECMKNRGLDKEFTIRTSARPASYRKLPRKSMAKFLRQVAEAEYIFLDDHVPTFDWMMLHKKTKVIQLWHAGAGFKSAGYSRWGHQGCPAPIGCHRQYQYGIAGSQKIAHFFSEVFGINEEQILPTGMPRMDEYLNPEFQEAKKKELYETYPICKGKKVILFAPTYRGVKRADAYYPYDIIDFDRLYDFCERENYAVIFKMHPWVSQPVPIEEEQKDRFVDANAYGNINDLFYVTDLLISDYSSNIYEYSLMRKPMLFFAFDKVHYSVARGFHRDYDETAPGKVCETFDEVMEALNNEDFEFEKVERYIEEQFDYIDSEASNRVIDWILLGNMPKELVEKQEKLQQRLDKMRQIDLSQWGL